MSVLYKWQIVYTIEEARAIAKLENHERAKTIPARLKEMRIQQWKNPLSASKKHTMQYTDDPIWDIGEWFDSHLDQQYEKNQNASLEYFQNI